MNILKSFADWLIKTETLSEEERDNFEYGLQQGLTILVNVFTVVLIGLAFNMLWQSIVFLIAYIPLRSFAGGYHARTQLRCYLLSIQLIISVLMVIRFISWTTIMILTMLLISVIIVLALAPVEDKNKPLDREEESRFRIKAKMILLFESLIVIISLLSGYEAFAVSLSISIAAVGLMLVFGKVSSYSVDVL